ncbi:MAG: methyltransferase domain-containing protein [Rhodospirillales bacterium]
MWSDVVELRDFYASPLGKTAEQVLQGTLRHAWPQVRGLRLAGYGYAGPFLMPFAAEARSLIALMPGPQGVVAWPPEGRNLACLVEEECLPLADLSLDRMLLVHALEHVPRPATLLREVWRVLDAEGRLLIVVPARRGLWARVDRTPFGWGRPFSRAQVTRLLNEMQFEQISVERALFVPPSSSSWLQRSAPAWERLGARWFPRFGGIIAIEARKRVTGLIGPTPARRRVVPVLPGLTRRNARPPPAPARTKA